MCLCKHQLCWMSLSDVTTQHYIFIKTDSIYVHSLMSTGILIYLKMQKLTCFICFTVTRQSRHFIELFIFFQHNYSTSSYGSMNSHTEGPGSGVGIPRSYPNTHRQPQVGTDIQIMFHFLILKRQVCVTVHVWKCVGLYITLVNN